MNRNPKAIERSSCTNMEKRPFGSTTTALEGGVHRMVEARELDFRTGYSLIFEKVLMIKNREDSLEKMT